MTDTVVESSEVVGIVLAAGLSERMGGDTPKQVLPVGGQPMIVSVVEAAGASALDRVVVVTGAGAPDVRAALPRAHVTFAHNPDFPTGNLSSLRVGLEAASPCGAVVLLLSDMPEVDVVAIDAMVDVWRREEPWAAVAVYGDGVPNHPFLLSDQAIDGVARIGGRKPLWRMLVESPTHPVTEVRFDRPAPVDVDTAEDYAELLRRLEI